MPQAETLTCMVSPNPADAELAVEVLAAHGIGARCFSGLRELAFALDERTGCIILVEEALVAEDLAALAEAFGRLPAWCDTPLIVVSRDVATVGSVVAAAFPSSGNVTLLDRPLNPHTLVSAVQVALRAAARQREVGELIAQRESAVRLRDEFLAMLAHELRNPLAPMRNAVYLLRKLKSEDPMLYTSTDILDRQVSHIVRMVDDLMDVARLERGKVVLQKQRIDLNRAVAAAVETSMPGAQARGHRVTVRYGAEALPVDADPVRVEQIVCNLVNNAAKFSPSPSEIRVQTGIERGEALVAVEDEGVGFAESERERLFDPFLQVNPTLDRSAGGLGMGLTIVKRLAELHGGSVQATSEGSGQGARFVVRLPVAEGRAQAEPAAVSEQAPRRRRRIVVVEDNIDIRESLRMVLTMWGHEVAMASDGAAGLDLVLSARPDIALIDVGLPTMNGYEVARSIRKVIPNGGIRLIAVTGYGQPSDRELARGAGFDGHLLKPIAPETLQALLGA
ncbi:MAG: response regulator [Betaproteobacteria bacterium]|nr:response regulator [Betaproteobacteria bacterium]